MHLFIDETCRLCRWLVAEIGDIGAERKRDAKLGVGTVFAIVLQQALAHVAGGDPNNGVFAGVIGGGSAEQFDADHALFK